MVHQTRSDLIALGVQEVLREVRCNPIELGKQHQQRHGNTSTGCILGQRAAPCDVLAEALMRGRGTHSISNQAGNELQPSQVLAGEQALPAGAALGLHQSVALLPVANRRALWTPSIRATAPML